jgi:hypothetical protein
MIKQLIHDNKNQEQCTKEDYELFLNNMFKELDKEDVTGEISLDTSRNFRILNDLIDILSEWEDISTEWKKKSK